MSDKEPALQPEWVAPHRTALILIDMQVDFGASDGQMAQRGADVRPAQAAVARAQVLAEAARGAGVRVVFVRLLNHPGGESPVASEARARHGKEEPDLCVEGTHGADFIGPQPAPGEAVISKTHFSAFTRTGLGEQLHSQKIDTVVLAGLTTECCVASSAWDAFERDLHIFIACDACAAYEESLHQGALRALQLSGAILGTTAQFAQAWKKSK